MTVAELTGLLHALAWPIVVLVAVALLRKELIGLFGRVREIEGPGNFKMSLDPNTVEQIIRDGMKTDTPAATVAERIVKAAIVLDKRESRILRALFDDTGRALFSYQSEYYKPALMSLETKKYLERVTTGGFKLTAEGERVTKEYLLGVIHSSDSSTPPHPAG